MKESKKNFIINKINPNEFNSFEKFEMKLKESVFGVLYVLLKDDHSSLILHLVLQTIEFLQLMIFPFDEIFFDSWGNGPIVKNINKFLNYINFVHYLKGRSESLYLTVFYVCVFLVTLMIINIIYVSYSFSRNFFTITWPLHILRHVAKAIVTIFFMPLQEIFISIYHCDLHNNKWENSYATDIECWNGIYFLHFFCSIAVSIIFIIISLVVALTYFECNESEENHGAKINSRADVNMLISKIITILIFTFLRYPNYEWFLITVIFFLSIFQFSKFYFEEPYYNKTLQLLMEIVNGIYMWTNFVLLCSKILQSYNFTGGIYVWATGIPLVIFFLFFKGRELSGLLSKNINKFQKGEEIEKQMRYLIRLFDKKGKKRENEILLKGFIRNHEENCGMIDCPLKNVKKFLDSNSGNLDIFSKNHNIQQYLLNFVNRIYSIGLSKFPNCTTLRISYSLFLYHHLKQKMNSFQEFSNAEKSNPPLDQQFIIFRYKKMINEDQDTIENLGEALDVVSGIAYDSHFRQCIISFYQGQTNIQNAAMLFLDFWGILNSQNSSPDLFKLNDLGLKINETLKNVHAHWHHMQHYKAGDSKALKMYASFWIDILNSKEKGQEFLNSKETGEKAQIVMKDFDFGKDENISTKMNEGYALLICSAEPDNFGTILKSTANGCKLFGFTENELWGKHVDTLFLDLYAESISNYLKHSINEWDSEKSKKTDSFYGKTKSHHSTLINLQLIDPKKIINDKVHFLLLISTEFNIQDLKLFKRSCHFIINNTLQISNYSIQANELFYLLFGKIPNDLSTLYTLFPELCVNIERDNDEDNIIKVSNTILNDLLIDNNSKNELVIKSRLNRGELQNNNNIECESYNCRFKIRTIDTNLTEKEEPLAYVAKKDENDVNNQGSLKEMFYFVGIDYSLTDKYSNKSTMKRGTLPESISSNLKLDLLAKDKFLLNESIQVKEVSISNVNESGVISSVIERKFNIDLVESKFLKMEFNKIINELKDNDSKFLNLMSFVRDMEKFKTLYRWNDDGDINNTHFISHNNFNQNKLSGNLDKKKEASKFSINKSKVDSEKKKKIMENNDYKEIVEISNLNNVIEFTTNNNITTILNNFETQEKELNNDIRMKEIEIKKNYFHNEDNDEESEESEEDSDSSDHSQSNSNKSPGEKSEHEEAIDIINSSEYLDLQGLGKRIEELKDYSKNIEFIFYRESGEKIPFLMTAQILEVKKNVNFLHEDSDSKKDKHTEISSSIPSKKNSEIHNDKTPPSLNKLRISSFLTLLIFIIYAIIDFSYNVNANTIIKNNFIMIFYSYMAINEITWSSYIIRNIILSNYLNFSNFAGQNMTSFNNTNYDQLYSSYTNLMSIANNLTSSNLNILTQHYNILKTNVVPLYFVDSSLIRVTNYYSLPDAIKSIYVKILTIWKSSPQIITETNIDVMNVLFNNYNDFMINLQKSAALYTSLMENNCNYYLVVFTIFFIVCIFLSILLTIIIYYNLTRVDIDRTKILGAFYEIPQYYVNKLYERCMNFIEKLNKNNGNISEDESDNSSLNDEAENLNKRRSSRRRLTNVNFGQGSSIYIIQITLTFLIVIIFFLINFISNIFSFNNLLRFNTIFNTTLQAESLYTFIYNLEREKVINKKFQVFNQTDLTIIDQTIMKIYDLNNNIILQNVQNQDIFEVTYLQLYNNTLYTNSCNLANITISQQQCMLYLNGLPEYGLQAMIIRFFEYLRSFQSDYILKNTGISYLDKLNNGIFMDLSIILQQFLKSFLSSISSSLNINISDYLQQQLNIRTIVFISFLIFIILGYLIIWLPFENKLNDEITRTKKMLDIIPYNILEKIDSLKEMH